MKFTYSWIKNCLYRLYLNDIKIKKIDDNNPHNNIIDLEKLNLQQMIQLLNKIGLEVTHVVDLGIRYKNFITAEIVATEAHPNADRLQICSVNTNINTDAIKQQIVCGAKNARNGIKVVLALPGAIVPANNMLIKSSKIRDIKSNGMLCSLSELCLKPEILYSLFDINKDPDPSVKNGTDQFKVDVEHHDGILELPKYAPVGVPFADYAHLNDFIITVELTPNRRQDCSSVNGIARELLAAFYFESIIKVPKTPETPKTHINANSISTEKNLKNKCIIDNHTQILVTSPESLLIDSELSPKQSDINVMIIDQENCLEFCYMYVQNIPQDIIHFSKYKVMSRWLSFIDSLHNNAIVNISNFAMFDIGRPNHIYDAEKICGNITIRQSRDSERFVALGGKIYHLQKGITVIADEEKIIAIAGVIGSELTKVDRETKNILIEIANFTPHCVMRAARALSLNTEAKIRFEAKVDQAYCIDFMYYMKSLLLDCYKSVNASTDITELQMIFHKPITVFSNIKVGYKEEINFDSNLISTFCGYNINPEIPIFILQHLGFIVKFVSKHDNKFIITIPTWKQGNIIFEEDVIEEILRICGFDYLEQYKNIDLISNDDPIKDQIKLNKTIQNSSSKSLSSIKNYKTIQTEFDFEFDFQTEFDLIQNLKQNLRLRGFDEAITFSFISEKSAKEFVCDDIKKIDLNSAINNNINIYDIETSDIKINDDKLNKPHKVLDNISITNPISEDMNVMRKTIIPSLLAVAEKNCARGYSNLVIFESCNVYYTLDNIYEKTANSNIINNKSIDKKSVDNKSSRQQYTTNNDFITKEDKTDHIYELQSIAGLRLGYNLEHKVHSARRLYDFYDIKDDILFCLNNISSCYDIDVNKIHFIPESLDYYHPGKSASIMISGQCIGYCGELHPSILKHRKLTNTNVLVFELFPRHILKLKHKLVHIIADTIKHKQLASQSPKITQFSEIDKFDINTMQYQFVQRDFSFIINYDIRSSYILEIITNMNIPSIRDVYIFDHYIIHSIQTASSTIQNTINNNKQEDNKQENQNQEPKKVSLTIRVVLQANDKTLIEADIAKICDQIVHVVQLKTGAQIKK